MLRQSGTELFEELNLKQTNDNLRLIGKKQYQAPSLTVYGDIVAITLTNANMSSASDGGTGSLKKTS